MTLRWSPADLSKQRAIVESAAWRAERSRRRLHAAEREAWWRFRRLLASPLGLAASFAMGIVAGAERPSATRARSAFANLRTVAARMIWLFELYRQFRDGLQARAPRPELPR